MMSIEIIQDAVKKIEADGMDGLWSAARLVGMPMALAILITHLRRSYGSMQQWPADAGIDTQVIADLGQKEPFVMSFLARVCGLFYSYEWYVFDNFSAFSVEWRGKLYPTAEHAYQAAKFHDEEIAERIRCARSPHEAKKIGGDVSLQDGVRPDWDDVRDSIMEEILRAKWGQHRYVQKVLARSKGIILVEDSDRDDYWGRGPSWNGKNRLGELWMKIRDEKYP